MNLEEIDESLPNGFHDAWLVGLEIDYVHGIAVFKTNVLIGLPDEPVEMRDRYRLGTLRFSGVSFVVVDPPDARNAVLTPGAVTFSWSRLDAAESPHIAELVPSGSDVQAYSFWVLNWCSSIHLAAREVSFDWSEAE
jgi:hypothetical protein